MSNTNDKAEESVMQNNEPVVGAMSAQVVPVKKLSEIKQIKLDSSIALLQEKLSHQLGITVEQLRSKRIVIEGTSVTLEDIEQLSKEEKVNE